jgi:hypothetical protein
MPGGDQTGPEGMGPMTGRQMGDCADSDAPRSASAAPGRGWWGWRRGRRGGRGPWGRRGFRVGPFGRGRRFWHSGPFPGFRLTQEQEVESLKDEAEWLKEQLDAVNQRLEEIKQE